MAEGYTRRLGIFASGLLVTGFLLTGFAVYMAGASSGFWRGGGDEAAEGEGAEEGIDMAGAQQIWDERCITCHGREGRGDGPGSAGLSPQPRNFNNASWQSEVDNEHIRRIVVSGGAAVGRSPAMPNNPDLREKPEVVEGLVRIVRGFGRP